MVGGQWFCTTPLDLPFSRRDNYRDNFDLILSSPDDEYSRLSFYSDSQVIL